MKTRIIPHSQVSTLSPGRIALGYAVIAVLWIAFSDEVVTHLNLHPAVMTIKGVVFVFVTAALLYFTIRRLVQAVELTSEALRRSNRELLAISNCNQVLLRATDEQSLLQEICRIVCEDAGYRAAWVGYAEHNETKSVRPVAWTGVEEGLLAKFGLTWADTELGRGPCGTAIRTGKTSCVEDWVTDPRAAPWREIVSRHGFLAVVALPLRDEQANTFGCLIIYSAEPNAFTSEEIRLLEEMTGDLAFGITTLRSQAARQQAEQKVSLLSFALDKGHEAAFLMDEARLYYVNEEACRRLGYTRGELLGMGISDIDPDRPAEHWAEHWRDLKAQRSLTFESRHRTRDGRIFPVEVSANYFEYKGRAYNLALVRDITERRRAEEERSTNLHFFQSMDRVNRAMQGTNDLEQVMRDVLDAMLSIYDCDRAWLVCPCDPDAALWRVHMERTKPEYPGGFSLATDIPMNPGTQTRFQRIATCPDAVTFGRGSDYPLEGDIPDRFGHKSQIAIALRPKTGKLWALGMHQCSHPRVWSEGEKNLLGEIARRMTDVLTGLLAHRDLRESEERYRITLQTAMDGFLRTDMQGRILEANETYCRMSGYSGQELLTMAITDVEGLHNIEMVAANIRRAAELGPYRFESAHRRKDGSLFDVEISAQKQAVDEGQVVVFVRDITERKRAEEEVRNTAAQWQATFDAVQDLVVLLDKDFQILRANRAAGEFLGLPLDKIVGGHCFNLIHGTPMPPAECPLAKMRQSRRHEETEVLARTGGPWLSVSVDPVFDQNGELTHVVHVARDITDRKRAEDALRRSEACLAEGQRLSHTGSWALDVSTRRYSYLSEEDFRIFGFDPQAGLPTREAFLRRIVPEDRNRLEESFQKSLREKADSFVEYRIVLPDGTMRDIYTIRHPVLNDAGEVVQIVGTSIDITERKRTEEELRKYREHLEDLVKQRTEQLAEAKARAEAANREKSRFLANMSHELRTPLNAVLGFSRLLKSGPDVTPRQQETLDIVVRSGEHLLNLINNVLDMARIESGRVVLEESEVDLHRLLHEIQSLMGVGAAEKGLRFDLERAPDLPRFVAVDAGKLRQVLLNLVGNAIKYTESGGVKLRARLTSRDGSENTNIRFEVEDSGPGLSLEDCHRVFFPFVQLGDQAPAQAGTGLGLAICKQYVELMGGQIGVASEPGKGSVFFFIIPMKILPSVAEPEELKHGRIVGLAEGQPRYRLLIVEDQPENRLLLRRLLEPLGFELWEAGNGQEAVTLFEQWQPNLVWMDIRMPVMDGLDAVRRIRATKAGASTKIIALTAHALEEESRTIMAAGFDDLVRKPFREHEIFDVLARHLRLKFIHEQATHQESAQEAPGLTLRPEQLDGLPAELLQDLRQAVLELDTARTQALIQQVAERDASLGRTLNALATQLDYKRLLKLLRKGQTS